MANRIEGKSRREENTEATRAALLASAQDAFAKQGFGRSSTEAIARAARVSRGAFYHHFADKKALFDAVVISLQIMAVDRVSERALQENDLWDRLYAGLDAYLEVCMEPVYARIVVRDARAVLGEERFMKIEGDYTVALLRANLAALHKAGRLAVDDPELLSQMVDAMVCRLAMTLQTDGAAPDQRDRCRDTLRSLLDGLKTGGD